LDISKYFLLFSLVYILTFISNSFALDVTDSAHGVAIAPDTAKISLLDRAYYYTDKSHEFPDIFALLAESVEFKPLAEKQIRLGGSYQWIKISLHNVADIEKTWLLELGFPNTIVLDAYWVKGDTIHPITAIKSSTPLSQRPVKDPLIFLSLNMQADESKTLYIHYRIRSDIPPSMNLYNETGFAAFRAKENLINGLFFGLIIATILIVFVHWLLNHNPIDIIYSALLLSMGLFIFVLSGYLSWVIPEQFIHYTGIMANKTLILTIIFNLLFMNVILNLKSRYKLIFTIYHWLIILNTFLLLLTPFFDTAKLAIVIISLIVPVKLYTAYWAFKQQETAFKVFAVSLLVQIILVNGLTLAISFGTILSLFDGFYDYIKFSFLVQIVSFGLIMALRNNELQQRLLITLQSQAEDKALLNKKDELFTAISHEIKTPLTLIYSPVKNALAHIKDERLKTGLKIASSNIHQLNKLVDQILSLARMDKRYRPKKSPVNFSQVIEFSLENIEPLFITKNIGLQTHISSHLYVSGNINDLEKIVANLLVNSAKYCPSNQAVEIFLTSRNNKCVFEVSNSIEKTQEVDIQKIFEPYFRSDIHKHSVGFGLGLTLVKQLVTSLEGQIEAFIKSGDKIVFVTELPLAKVGNDTSAMLEKLSASPSIDNELQIHNVSMPNVITTASNPTETSTNQKEQILIVEDDEQLRFILHESLKTHYDCYTSDNGKDGINKAVDIIPDLILTDLMMPLKSGIELAQAVRENTLSSHIPIIMLTAKGDSESRLLSWQSNIDAFIAKPFEPEELLARIENLLSIRRLLSNRTQHYLDACSSCDTSSDKPKARIPGLHPKDKEFIGRIDAILAQHYSEQIFNVAALSEKMCISERQLARKMKAIVNKTASDYIRTYRLNEGEKLLQQGYSITQVAFEVGFSSQNYFSNCFKAHFGASPSAYTQSS
jgi:signal transduction histidine kinase/DNA-binding response OmpR family regulator